MSIKYTINKSEITKQSLKFLKSEAGELVYPVIKNKFEINKEILINDVIEDDITQSLKQRTDGGDAGLMLGPGKGSLFGFIGFESSRDPVKEVTDILQNDIKFKKTPIDSKMYSDRITLSYQVNLPTEKDWEDKAPMPSYSNGSWVKGIETGILGLMSYIYWKIDNSRSGGGTQAKDRKGGNKEIRSALFVPRSYVTKYIDSFMDRLKYTRNSLGQFTKQ